MKKINRTLIAALLIIILVVSTIMFIVNNVGKDEQGIILAEEIYNEKYWSKEIIKEEKENTPIPIGCEYITGTQETGVIVQNKETNEYLMWVPYDDSIQTNNTEGYYENCNTIEMSSEEADSISLYGGFYVYLTEEENSYEQLKQINEEDYMKLYEKAQEKGKSLNTLNSGLITENQIYQVENYINKISSDNNMLGSNDGIKVDKLLSINSNEKIEKTSNTSYPQIKPSIVTAYPEIYTKLKNEGIVKIETYEGQEVVVPQGYSVFIKDSTKGVQNYDTSKVIKIQDESNEELRYVWIPVNEEVGASSLSDAKTELATYYENENKEMSYAKDASETIESGLTDSVNAYGGFFMAEAELRYVETDGTKKIANTAIGMKLTEDGVPYIIEGNYYRGNEVGTIEKAKEIAEGISNNSKSVVSHLTYGAEWDAMMIWLIKSGAISQEEAVTDGSEFPGAKYHGTYEVNDENEEVVLATEDLKGANGLYGIAGNIADITMEKYDNKVVVRGGSYIYTPTENTAGSRLPIEDKDLQDEDIGFRNCLYIRADLEELKEKGEKINYVALGDSIAYGYGVEESERYAELIKGKAKRELYKCRI